MSQQCIEICSQICNNKYGGTYMNKDLKIKHGFTLAEVFSVHPKGGRKQAFTLAEVLITLGIIGVVAAMTLPTLIQKHQIRTFKTQFKKSYSTISNALNKAQFDMGENVLCYYGTKESKNSWREIVDCNSLYTEIVKNLNVIKTCNGNAEQEGCIPKPYLPSYTTNSGCAGYSENGIKNRNHWYMLADGSAFMPFLSNYLYYPLFLLDINGPKKPNLYGQDVFSLALVKENSGNIVIGRSGKLEGTGLSTASVIACLPGVDTSSAYFKSIYDLLD